MPGDDQDRAAQGDDGAFGAAAAGDPPVFLAEEGVGLGGARGGVAQYGGQVGVAVPGGALAFLLARRLADAGGQPGPGGQMPGGGEPGHVGADLSEDHVRAGQADPGDLIELGDRGRERGGLLGDPLIQGGDIGADRVDPAQHRAKQERVVAGEVTGEGLFQHGDLAAHGAPGQLREHLRVLLPGDQRREHVPAGDPEDVRDDRADLDAGILQ